MLHNNPDTHLYRQTEKQLQTNTNTHTHTPFQNPNKQTAKKTSRNGLFISNCRTLLPGAET